MCEFDKIKTNITCSLCERMVSAVDHISVGYYDSITKKVRAHVNERSVVNYIMCPAMTKKLRHISGDKSLVNPYQKPQRLINCLIELFPDLDDWVLDLFSSTCIVYMDYSIWMLLWFVTKARECNLTCFMLSCTTATCALKMFMNSVALEKDSEQVNFIKM